MTDGYLYRLSQRLRLLARATVRTAQDGRILGGEINAAIEAQRLALNEAIDRIVDGLPLLPEQQEAVTACEALAAERRADIRALELALQ